MKKNSGNSKGSFGGLWIIRTLLLVILITGSVAAVALAAKNKATTIRLVKTEGDVTVVNSKKEELVQTEDMRLYSGDHQITDDASYAWLSLDSSKAIKLDENSETELRKKGKKLEVLVDSGSVFFNVTVPLESDETLNIRSSTMITGIRGTCGWVRILDGGETRVFLLEGSLECVVTDPVSGETKTITLKPGEYADFYVYEAGHQGDATEIVSKPFTKEDIEPYVLVELVGDTDLVNKIYEQSGIDLRDLGDGNAKQKLTERQKLIRVRKREIGGKAAEQDGIVSKDPVWSDEKGEDDSIVYLTMPQTASTVQKYLDDQKVKKVVLLPGSVGEEENTLKVDVVFETPDGKILEAREGVPVRVEEGKSFTTNGTSELRDVLTNRGLVVVNSSNTLRAYRKIMNYGTLENTASGRIVLAEGLFSEGTFRTAGVVEALEGTTGDALITVTAGQFVISDGRIVSDRHKTVIEIQSGGEVSLGLDGGFISNDQEGGTTIKVNSTDFHVNSMKTDIMGVTDTLLGEETDLAEYEAATVWRTDGHYHLIALSAVESYPVIIVKTAHGSITAPDRVEVGATVPLAVEPDAGYELQSLTVNLYDGGKKGAAVGVSADYHFVMPGSDVIIEGSFEKKDAQGGQGTQNQEDPDGTNPDDTADVGKSYSVTVRATHGTVQSSVRKAKENDRVTLTATPEVGYEFVGLEVKDANGNAIAVSANGNGYVFAMPAGNVTVSATFRVLQYTITFYDTDGRTVLNTQTLDYGTVPAYAGSTPYHASTTQYDYSFDGWKNLAGATYGPNTALPAVTGNESYTAQFDLSVRSYTVTFYGEDGTTKLSQKSFRYGSVPVYDGITPKKTATPQYSYIFSGWKSGANTYGLEDALPSVAGDASYAAVFESKVNICDVTWKNEDGTTLEVDENVTYGSTPVYDGVMPAKTGNAQYTYKFSGWTDGENSYGPEDVLPVITESITYTATFDAVVNTYTVTWKNEDGAVIKTDENVVYGTKPSYEGEDPVKAATVQYRYVLAGWKNGETEYRYTYSGTGTGTGDGTGDGGKTGGDGGSGVIQPGEILLERSIDLPEVTGDVTYAAFYTEVLKQYLVTFVDEDGTTVLKAATLYDYGTAAEGITAPTDPAKAATDEYEYTFAGWTPAIASVSGDATYKATYSARKRVTGVALDQKTMTLRYSAAAAVSGTLTATVSPADAADTSVSWSSSDEAHSVVTLTDNGDGTATITAVGPGTAAITVRSAVDNKTDTCVVTVEMPVSGVMLSAEAIDVQVGGEAASLTATVSPDNATNKTVTWKSADETVATVTDNGDGTATVTAVGNGTTTITVTTEDGEYSASCNVRVTTPVTGVSLDRTAAEVYLGTTQTLTATVTPETASNQNVSFTSSNTDVATVAAGQTAGTCVITPVATGTTTITVTTEDGAKTATCAVTVKAYTVTFRNDDEAQTSLQTNQYAYGDRPSYTGTVMPTKASTAQYDYVFRGWTVDGTATYTTETGLPEVTADATYTAVYEPVLRRYRVTFVDEDGTMVLRASAYDYGTAGAAIAQPEAPDKEATAQYTYSFAGWSDGETTYTEETGLPAVTGEVTYRAAYTATVNEYTVNFWNALEDEIPLESKSVPYGSAPTYTGETPTKAATAEYTYDFIGWGNSDGMPVDLTDVAVEGDMDFYARFSETLRQYNVTFVDEDGTTVLKAATLYDYGTAAEGITAPTDPAKAATDEYEYTFAGWTPAVANVSGDATYKATYSARKRVTSVALNQKTMTLRYSAAAAVSGTLTATVLPADASDTSVGWSSSDETGSVVTLTDNGDGTATITAVAPGTATITAKSAVDNKTDACVVTVEMPVSGVMLDAEGIAVQVGGEAAILTATVSPDNATNKTVTWESADETVATVTDNGDGTATVTAVGNGTALITVKTEDGEYSASCNVWVTTPVTGVSLDKTAATIYLGTTQTLTATVTPETASNQNVSFTSSNTDVATVAVGDAPGTCVITPVATGTTTITVTTEDGAKTATCAVTVKAYTVTFRNDDEAQTTLLTNQYAYGDRPSYTGTVMPTKASTAQYDYVFRGWTVDGTATYTTETGLPEVTADATYKAVYTPAARSYTIAYDFNAGNDNVTFLEDIVAEDYTYGEGATLPTGLYRNGYDFIGWFESATPAEGEAAVTSVGTEETGDKTYYAGWQIKTYTVTWKNTDGTTLETDAAVSHGTKASYDGETPTKAMDNDYVYTFAGWTDAKNNRYAADGSDLPNVMENITFTAIYSTTEVVHVGEIHFMTGGSEGNLYLGGDPGTDQDTLTATISPSEATIQDVIWESSDPEVVSITGEGLTVTVKALKKGTSTITVTSKDTYGGTHSDSLSFTVTAIRYDVSFLSEDGAPMKTASLEYGTTPVYEDDTHETPAKEASVDVVYTFGGWKLDNETYGPEETLPTVTGDMTFHVVFTSAPRKYTITFYDEDGTTVLDAPEVVYGDKPVYGGETPAKAATNGYTYAFRGWDGDVAVFTDETLPVVTGARSYKASYAETPRTYAVTLNLNVGDDETASIDGREVTEYTYGEGETLPRNARREGYIFSGWYTSAAPEEADSAVTEIGATEYGDKVFYAKWTRITTGTTYTVAVDSSWSGIITPDKTSAEEGETVTLTISTADRQICTGIYYTDPTGTSDTRIYVLNEPLLDTDTVTFEMPAQDITLDAEFGYMYDVRAEYYDRGGSVIVPKQALPGTTVTVQVRLNDGYAVTALTYDYTTMEMNGKTFTTVQHSEELTLADGVASFTMPSSEVTVRATILDESGTTYRIAVEESENGSFEILNEVSVFAAGTKISLSAESDEGYEFDHFEVRDETGASVSMIDDSSFYMPENNVSVKAYFNKLYGITYAYGSENGNTIYGDTQVATGKEASFYVMSSYYSTPRSTSGDCYRNESLSVKDAEGNDIPYEVDHGSGSIVYYTFTMPEKDVIIDGTFGTYYKIVLNCGEHGSVTVDKPYAKYMEDVTITVTPDAGYGLSSATCATYRVQKETTTITSRFTWQEDSNTYTYTFQNKASSNVPSEGTVFTFTFEPMFVTELTIDGTPRVGETLTAVLTDSNADASTVHYAWKSSKEGADTYSASTYVVRAEDVGYTISCRVYVIGMAGSYTAVTAEVTE